MPPPTQPSVFAKCPWLCLMQEIWFSYLRLWGTTFSCLLEITVKTGTKHQTDCLLYIYYLCFVIKSRKLQMSFPVCVPLRITGMAALEVTDLWYLGSANEELGTFFWVLLHPAVKKTKFWEVCEDSLCKACLLSFLFVCNVVSSGREVNLRWRYVMCK